MHKKITLYIGTNDKNTKKHGLFALWRAQKKVFKVITEDCTIHKGKGRYTHEDDGTVIKEPTLIVEIIDFKNKMDETRLHQISDGLKEALNQESIAIQKTEVESDLY